MQTVKQAIKVARVDEGWAWFLLNGEGAPAAAGTAPAQETAMEFAWRAARLFAPAAAEIYPEIIVEQPCSVGRPRAQAQSNSGRGVGRSS
jgi:hypothetical protein